MLPKMVFIIRYLALFTSGNIKKNKNKIMVFPYVDKKLSIKLTSEILVALLFDFFVSDGSFKAHI